MNSRYITLFVVAFPLAPCLALINNYAEIRMNAFKLARETRRPDPKGAKDIGSWQMILDILVYVSVVTNVALIVFTSKNIFGASTPYEKVWAFILLERSVALFKWILSWTMNDVPKEASMHWKRQRYVDFRFFVFVFSRTRL
jgi:hypothetical protein